MQKVATIQQMMKHRTWSYTQSFFIAAHNENSRTVRGLVTQVVHAISQILGQVSVPGQTLITDSCETVHSDCFDDTCANSMVICDLGADFTRQSIRRLVLQQVALDREVHGLSQAEIAITP